MKRFFFLRVHWPLRLVILVLLGSYIIVSLVFFLHDEPLPKTDKHGSVNGQLNNKKRAAKQKHNVTDDRMKLGNQANFDSIGKNHTNSESFSGCDSLYRTVRSKWNTHKCYSTLSVDGTEQSIKRYVNELTNTCFTEYAHGRMAKIRTSITELISLVVTDDEHTNSNQFMRERIKRMWSQWMDGLDRYKRWIDQSSTQLTVKPNLYNRIKLHIHIHLGLLTLGPSVGIEEEINKGGPLGELVQWTDLITALYLLGHKITVSKNIAQTVHLLLDGKFHDTPCSGISERPHLVYTDIRGFRQLEKSKASFPKCKFRVLDSFGTENKYNLKVPVQFSGLKLNLQQFQTFFPHTPDNSFLGFVIDNSDAAPMIPRGSTDRPIALVAGKVVQMWKNATAYLTTLSEFFEIHGNVADVSDAKQLPSFVTNHKVLSGREYISLLKSATVLVGLGFPYESPGPLEAIAHGVIFLNVKFKSPHNKKTVKFFEDKPTDRQLTSQHPYIEDYMGEPYSYLMLPEDTEHVRETVRRLLSTPVDTGYTPFEFTTTGYLERLNALLNHQDFCTGQASSQSTAFTPTLAPAGWSCNKACESVERLSPPLTILSGPQTTKESIQVVPSSYLDHRYEYARPRTASVKWQRLRCAPQYFTELNRADKLSQLWNFTCRTSVPSADMTAPFVDVTQGTCSFQLNNLRFSCTYPDPSDPVKPNIQRICPCHTRLLGQSTLCEQCV